MARTKPPILPFEVLRRVVRLSRMDGTTVMALSGTLAIVSAAGHDLNAACVGLAIALAGAAELHGGSLLRSGEVRGLRWLSGSQLYLMAVILGVCARNLVHPDMDLIRQAVTLESGIITPEQKAAIQGAGLNMEQFFLEAYRLGYLAVGAATVLYSGGLALYYATKRKAIEAALHPVDEE